MSIAAGYKLVQTRHKSIFCKSASIASQRIMDGYVKFTKDRDDNKAEKERLGYQHEILLHAMRGRAILAPVDLSRPSLRILDSGAADGRWLTDLRSSIGGDSHEYVGTDIDPSLYPSSPPEDVYFCNQSIRKPFPDEWQGTFDVVHQRLVMAAAAPPDSTIASVASNLAGLLRPGGWLQLVELDNECVNDNGPALRRLLHYHQQNSAAGGLGPNLSVHLTRAMQEAGLKGVEERSIDVMYGVRNKGGRELRMKSMRSLYGAVGPVLAQAKLATPKKFDEYDARTLPSRLWDELEMVGGRIRFVVIYGQKG